MVPLSTLFDEYIDRSKLTEQKKTPFEYLVTSLKRVGTMKTAIVFVSHNTIFFAFFICKKIYS